VREGARNFAGRNPTSWQSGRLAILLLFLMLLLFDRNQSSMSKSKEHEKTTAIGIKVDPPHSYASMIRRTCSIIPAASTARAAARKQLGFGVSSRSRLHDTGVSIAPKFFADAAGNGNFADPGRRKVRLQGADIILLNVTLERSCDC